MGSKSKKPAARLGDLVSNHGPWPPTPIIGGSGNVLINGRPAARQGDPALLHAIPNNPPHGRSIAEGSSSVLINGKPAARVSDAISCGGDVAIGSGNVLIGNSPKLLNVEALNLPKLNTPPLTFDRDTIQDGDSNQTSTKAKQESETVKYEVQDHTNDTNVGTEPPPPIEQHKNSAVDYWQNKKDQADNFPEYFAAHLLGLNAETGYNIAEGIASTFETVTDPEKFKQSMVNTAQSLADVVTDPKGTYEAIKQSAVDFSNLSSADQADFAYKTAMGLLAGGGGAGKGVGALGKMGKNKRKDKRDGERANSRQDKAVESEDSTIADGNVVPNKINMRSADDLMGVEPASPELISAVSKKRDVVIAQPGSEELRMLDYFGAEASVGGANNTHILLRENPSKAALLEEFLHGTQSKLGITDRLGTSGLGSAETHVKDFMIRHQKVLGLGDEDVQILQILRDKGL